MRQFDWPTIRAAYERGLTPTEIATTLPDSPSRQAIDKRIKREAWQVARLPPATALATPRDIVLQRIRDGATKAIAAKEAGIHRTTLHRWLDDDATFATAIEAAHAAHISECQRGIKEAGKRDWKAYSYILERDPATRDEYGTQKTDNSLTIVLQVDRSEGKGVTIEHETTPST